MRKNITPGMLWRMIMIFKKRKKLIENGPYGIVLNKNTDLALVKSLIEVVNKSPTLKVTLTTVDGSVLNIWDSKSNLKVDDSMLGF